MRIEKRYPAFGHDLDADVSPLEAGLDFAVAWEKPFIGRDALLARREKGIASRMVSILLDDADAVPHGSEPVWWSGRIVGLATSAAFGYRVGRPVALGYVETAAATEGQRVEIDIAGVRCAGEVSLAAAYDPAGTRLRGVAAAGAAGAAGAAASS
jgi:4-methylaminobutanoate oxidase (formaldehyde-forming)